MNRKLAVVQRIRLIRLGSAPLALVALAASATTLGCGSPTPERAGTVANALVADSTRAPGNPNQYPTYQGGPILQPEIVPIYWGTFTQGEIDASQAYLAGLVGYMSGDDSPPGQQPTIAQYGVKGASLYPTYYQDTVLPSDGSAGVGHVSSNGDTIESEIANVQSRSANPAPGWGPERVFLLLTSGISIDKLSSSGTIVDWGLGGEHFHNVHGSPNRWIALVPYVTPASEWQRRISHEIFETATDADQTGWKVGGNVESEICDSPTPSSIGWGCDSAGVQALGSDGGIGVVAKCIDVIQSDVVATCSAWTNEQLPQISATTLSGATDLFAFAEDRSITHIGSATGWSGWDALGGAFSGPPVAVAGADGPGTLRVFGQGTDGAFYTKEWDGSAWAPAGAGNYANIGRAGSRLNGQPAVAQWGLAGQVEVFGQGTDGAYYHDGGWDGSSWAGWKLVGGVFNGPPTAISNGLGIELFGRGTDGRYYHKSYDGSVFTPASPSSWQLVGSGQFISEPTVVASVNGVEVFGQGTDWAYYHYSPSGSGWSSLERLGGAFNGPPQVSSQASGVLDVVGQGTDSQYYHLQRVSGTWTAPWQPVHTGSAGLGAGTLIPRGGSPGAVDLWIVGTDYVAYGDTLTANTWAPQGFTGIGGSLH